MSGPYHYSDRTDQEEARDQGKVWPVSCLSLFEKIGVPVWLAVADSTEDRYRQGQGRCKCTLHFVVARSNGISSPLPTAVLEASATHVDLYTRMEQQCDLLDVSETSRRLTGASTTCQCQRKRIAGSFANNCCRSVNLTLLHVLQQPVVAWHNAQWSAKQVFAC